MHVEHVELQLECVRQRCTQKYFSYYPSLQTTVRRKFSIRDGEDLVLVDEHEGFSIDDDVLGDIVTSQPDVSLMVLKEDEEWSMALARQLLKQNGNLTVMELLSSFDSSDQNKEGWNSGTSAILLLLCLLPPASQGRSKAASAKVSISSAISRIIQFQKSGGSIQDFLDGTKQTQSQPFLLGIGNSKACISSYLLIVDHKAIPCGARTVEGAVDELFKTHFVFGLHYCQSLHQFWTFIQTAVFEIDVGVSRESPRVRELRSKLFTP
ncbi:uncharacterized protein [Diadema antillarum]|uniref:uncharacterized protein n=1 Tax=Diadema antillarum TaxID=105358 RepID=UPI003A84106C